MAADSMAITASAYECALTAAEIDVQLGEEAGREGDAGLAEQQDGEGERERRLATAEARGRRRGRARGRPVPPTTVMTAKLPSTKKA